jgi:hypothetical protein
MSRRELNRLLEEGKCSSVSCIKNPGTDHTIFVKKLLCLSLTCKVDSLLLEQMTTASAGGPWIFFYIYSLYDNTVQYVVVIRFEYLQRKCLANQLGQREDGAPYLLQG